MTLLAQEVWVARLCQGTIRHLDDLWWRIIVYLRIAEGVPYDHMRCTAELWRTGRSCAMVGGQPLAIRKTPMITVHVAERTPSTS